MVVIDTNSVEDVGVDVDDSKAYFESGISNTSRSPRVELSDYDAAHIVREHRLS